MKLIELIIKHVPRDDIHPDAKFFTQDSHPCNNRLAQFKEKPVANHSGMTGCWCCKGYIIGSQITVSELAEDARDTVVTREQLEYLWNLQDQGYTLAFGAEPMPSGTWFVENYYTLSDGIVYHADKKSEGVITAYNPGQRFSVKNESRPRVEYHELDHADTIVAAAIEKRLSLDGDAKWSVDSDKICVNLKTGYLSANGDDLVIITRKQWDDYISRKIRVGDKVKSSSGVVATVLYVGDKKAFVRTPDDIELTLRLERLTRVSE